jgi:predicted nucleotidyltransferase
MKKLSEIIDILHAHSGELRERYGIVNLAVFGSVVRGEEKEGSDIDVLANIEKSISLLDIIDAEYYLSDLLGTKVDLVPARSVRPELKKHILEEAVPV